MKNRILAQLLFAALLGIRAAGQNSLDFFTNYANILLQPEFGCSVTNIPVYSTVDPAVGYSAALHYQLQTAADAYDAISPATDPPSVFRPLFSWQGNMLLIVGYALVTNDAQAQIARGFKDLTNSAITTNDNVWGVPWVIGTKPGIPAFNEYSYASELSVSRLLQFVRFPSINGGYDTTRSPRYTNQFYLMSVSNAFGTEAWNFSPAIFTDSVTILCSNEISVTLTNNYNFGLKTNFFYYPKTSVNSWPGWPGFGKSSGFIIPSFSNTVILPYSYWSEATGQLIQMPNGGGFLPADSAQLGWPVHAWALNITNNLMYALIDNASGQPLDFVNLGGFGSSFNFNQVLSNTPGSASLWITSPANDNFNSPLSTGVLNQIAQAMTNPLFANSLLGRSPGFPSQVGTFYTPGSLSASMLQSCSWSAANPLVHFTIQDLTNSNPSQKISFLSTVAASQPISLSNSPCSLGVVNPGYTPSSVKNLNYNLSDYFFQLNFTGAVDLPYQIWTSTDLLNWGELGTALQLGPGQFGFEDSFSPMDSGKFYQVRLP